jgi:hypothetical protein
MVAFIFAAKSFQMAASARRDSQPRYAHRTCTRCYVTAPQVFKMRNKSANSKMKKQAMAMEAIDHCNILKIYDHFDEEDDGASYVVRHPCSSMHFLQRKITCL